MKRTTHPENRTFGQRKADRIQAKEKPTRVPLYVLGGCDIAQMCVWAQLNWDGSRILGTSQCEFATSGDLQKSNLKRVSGRGEPIILSCDCTNAECDHHTKNRKK